MIEGNSVRARHVEILLHIAEVSPLPDRIGQRASRGRRAFCGGGNSRSGLGGRFAGSRRARAHVARAHVAQFDERGAAAVAGRQRDSAVRIDGRAADALQEINEFAPS